MHNGKLRRNKYKANNHQLANVKNKGENCFNEEFKSHYYSLEEKKTKISPAAADENY